MLAVVLKNEKFTVEEVPDISLKPNEVKVKVEYCGICGTDVHAYEAGPPYLTLQTKNIMGHESVGVIDEVGKGVTGFKVGDRVTSVAPGAYAQYLKCDTSELHKVPEGMPSDLAALIEPVAVSLRGVRRSGISPGMSAAIIGAGPIGLFALMILKARGVDKIVVSEPGERRRNFAAKVGATLAVEPRDLVKDSREVSGQNGVDVTFECVGAIKAIDAAFSCTSNGGKIVIMGVLNDKYPLNVLTFIMREITLVPSCSCHDEFELAIDLLSKGEMPALEAVTNKISLKDMPGMFEQLTRDPDSEVKVLLDPWA